MRVTAHDSNDHVWTPGARRCTWVAISVASSLLTSCLNLAGHGEKEIRYELTHRFPIEDPQFLRSMGQLLGPAIVPGNHVTAYQNGDEVFPAMLAAIAGAKESITFETYIYWSGDIGQKFADALSERARAGVKVHVMLDWLGAGKIDAQYLAAMNAAGVEVERYHPLRWYNWSRLNNRTHRKLLVVDGRIGFTGGIGIADAWEGDGWDGRRQRRRERSGRTGERRVGPPRPKQTSGGHQCRRDRLVSRSGA